MSALGDEWRGFWIACIRETFEGGWLDARIHPMVNWCPLDPAVQARFADYREPRIDGTFIVVRHLSERT